MCGRAAMPMLGSSRWRVEAVGHNDPSRILCDSAEALESHLIVFAAEKARKAHNVHSMNADRPWRLQPC